MKKLHEEKFLKKLEERMKVAGYKEGWESDGFLTQFRQGQFSVYEWLKREFEVIINAEE